MYVIVYGPLPTIVGAFVPINIVYCLLSTCIFLYFCINKDNLDVNGLFSFHLVFFKSDIYASKWLKNAENVAARYDPTAIQCGGWWWGSSPPPPPPTHTHTHTHSTLKSCQVCAPSTTSVADLEGPLPGGVPKSARSAEGEGAVGEKPSCRWGSGGPPPGNFLENGCTWCILSLFFAEFVFFPNKCV